MKKKVHNLLSLMLELWFRNLHLVSSFVGHGQSISIIEKYDKKSLHPIFSKSSQHLHFVTNCEIGYVD